jgi:hypothetical protein
VVLGPAALVQFGAQPDQVLQRGRVYLAGHYRGDQASQVNEPGTVPSSHAPPSLPLVGGGGARRRPTAPGLRRSTRPSARSCHPGA